jgi:hypothetical protein
MRAPRSISFDDISETVDLLSWGWQSGISPTVTRTLVPGQKLLGRNSSMRLDVLVSGERTFRTP